MTGQSAIMQFVYERISDLLTERGKQSALFSVTATPPSDVRGGTLVFIAATDVCQIQTDRTGQKITLGTSEVDIPALCVMSLTILIYGISYGAMLAAAGSIIAFLKDNSVQPCERYNWHGNTHDTFFIEPVIREPTDGKDISDKKVICLEYRIEVGINSEKEQPFKRVEKRTIQSNMLGKRT